MVNIYRYLFLFIIFLILLPLHENAHAYIGPGAGFAVLSSFFMVFAAFFFALLNLISWPLRYLWRQIRGKNAYKNARAAKVIILGLDGLDHELIRQFMKQGKCPNFQKLSESGRFAPLQTTFPSISPVAWSSFQTGTNPAKHNIFDFMVPDWKSYLPRLSSAFIGNVEKNINLGKYCIPVGKPAVKLLRRSVPFWKILGDKGIFTNIIRVPITFPPEKCNGLLLGAMCIPDLRGTQGSFTWFTSREKSEGHTGGTHITAEHKDGCFIMNLPGPANPLTRDHQPIQVPLVIEPNGKNGTAVLTVSGQKIHIKQGQYTEWIKVTFNAGLGVKISGICRFLAKSLDPELDLYVTPINIDPDKPALPISWPAVYSTYLAKKHGSFATLGLAEDTWALNERIIDEGQFLQQTWDIHAEREWMFFNALDNMDRGVLACVFDSTDRIQHTFMRYLHSDHPANRGRDTIVFQKAIEQLYEKCDDLVGRILEKLDDHTIFIIMSDHGFKAFKRGVNINRWLLDNGYLVLKDDASGGEWFDGVDWSKTRAYALGLAGIFFNRKGREGHGIVSKDQVNALKKEIINKLTGLQDPDRKETAITQVFNSADVMKGPYLEWAPELIVGYKPGYRASWASATGTVLEDLFTDNIKAWSGDHCMDPRAVPGIFFCNKKVSNRELSIMDIAPTVLDIFGVKCPPYMDGKPLEIEL